MKAKRRRYLILLFISIAIRTFFYFFPFEGTAFEWIAQSHILYDIIFFAILISLLNLLKERKWLIGLTWLTLIDSVAYNVLKWVQDEYSPFTRPQYARYNVIIALIILAFYVCIFFARKSPSRIFLRCMAASFLPYIYVIFAIIFHLRDPGPLFSSRAFIAILSILLNILLAIAVWRTSELRQDEYADFLIE